LIGPKGDIILNENNENNYPPNYEPGDYAARIEEKLYEQADYKKLLFTLAMSVIGVTILVQVAFAVAYGIIVSITNQTDLGVFDQFVYMLETSGVTNHVNEIAYALLWLMNDLVVYLIPMLVFGYIFRKRMNHQKQGEPYEYKYYWVVPLFFAGIMLSNVASIVTNVIAEIFSEAVGGEGLPDVFADVMPQNNAELLIMLVTVGVVAPICEEIIYRHMLLKPLRRYGDFQAIVITSVLFGFFHGNLTQFLYATIVGFVLGFAAVRANSVLPAIIIHSMNNVFAVLFSRFYELSEAGSIQLSTEGISGIWIVVIITGLVSLVAMAVKGNLDVENHNPYLSPRERLRLTALRPSIIIMTVFLLLYTIVGTMII